MPDSLEDMRHELFDLARRMRHGASTAPVPPGVTAAEAHAIMGVCMMQRRGEDVRPGHLARCAHTTPSALSQTLKSLEDKGLIARRRADGDSRGVSVALTESGQRVADETRRLREARMDEVVAYVGEDDMREMLRIMRRAVEFSERRAQEAPAGPARGGRGAAGGQGGAPCA